MPLLIYLKSPSIVLLADDLPEGSTLDQLGDTLGGAIKVNLVGKPAIIPVRADSSVTYIKEVSQEEMEELQKKKEAEKEAGRIARPSMLIPRGIKGPGN
jgi:hypothetical protein